MSPYTPNVEHQAFLPRPVPADAPDLGIHREPWMADAACHGQTDLFFRARGDRYDEARLICHGCPVRDECLAYALRVNNDHSDHGCWGGTSPRQRRALRRQKRAA